MSVRVVEREWNLAGGARIRVRGHNGTEHTVELQLTAKVLELKAKLGALIGIPPRGLVIMLGDAVLEDNTTLEAAHVQESIALKFEIRSTSLQQTIPITFTMPSGQTVRVVVPETATVEDLKAALREKDPRLSAANIRLTVQQRDVEPNATMRELAEEPVQVITQLDGGLQ